MTKATQGSKPAKRSTTTRSDAAKSSKSSSSLPSLKKDSAKPSSRKAGAKYQWASKLALFEDSDDPRFTTAEAGDSATFAFQGEPFATMKLIDDDIELGVRLPQDLREFENVLHHYERDPGDWARIRRPATRDPRPWLEADFGSLVGTVMHELKQSAAFEKFHSIVSAGGPFVVMPSDLRVRWFGAGEPSSYESLNGGGDPAFVKEIAGAPAIVLTVPDETTWMPAKSGGTLVQIVSHDRGGTEQVRCYFSELPREGFRAIESNFVVRSSLHCFDGALSGGSVGNAEALVLNLTPGSYCVDARTFVPEDGTELGADPILPRIVVQVAV